MFRSGANSNVLGSAMIAVAALSLLTPQAAKALDFTFEFEGVSGIIKGLQDGVSQLPVSVEVISSPIGGTGLYPYVSGPGFTVTTVAGVSSVTAAQWFGQPVVNGPSLSFDTNLGSGVAIVGNLNLGGGVQRIGGFDFKPVATPPPTPSSVPGPLPVLGAAAAFGVSRKLRKRIKGGAIAVPTASIV